MESHVFLSDVAFLPNNFVSFNTLKRTLFSRREMFITAQTMTSLTFNLRATSRNERAGKSNLPQTLVTALPGDQIPAFVTPPPLSQIAVAAGAGTIHGKVEIQ